MHRRFLLLLTLFSLIPGVFFSQEPIFRHITPHDGLNDGTINSMAQDRHGQMWLATWDGLMKYDGYQVTNYKPLLHVDHSLPSKRIQNLFSDSKGNLWVLTDIGISRYDPVTDHFIRYTIDNFQSWTRIFEVQNLVFANIPEKGIILLSDLIAEEVELAEKIPVYHKDRPLAYPNFYYAVESSGHIYLCQWADNADSLSASHIYIALYDDKNAGRIITQEEFTIPGKIQAIQSFGTTRVFIGTDRGLYVYSLQQKTSELIPSTSNLDITSLLITSDNKLWIGTEMSGLGCYNLHTGTIDFIYHDPNKPTSLLDNSVYSLFEDFSGNLFVGHGGAGLSLSNLKQKAFETYRFDPGSKNSLSNNTVFTFHETDEGILIGTSDGLNLMITDATGMLSFTRLTIPEHFSRTRSISRINFICKESRSVFWLGTNFGLIKAEQSGHEWSFKQYPQFGLVRQIFIDQNRNLWVGTYNGLCLVPFSHRNTMQFFRYTPNPVDEESLSDKVISAIFLDKNNNFYVGTREGGLNILKGKFNQTDLSGETRPELRFTRYDPRFTDKNILNNDEVNCIFEHQDGTLWIGTQGGGVNIFNPVTETFSYLMENDGLPGNNVFGILPDHHGNIWLSTNKGLSYHNVLDQSFTNYSPDDGIQGNVFMINAFFRSTSGKLYFGGRHGFTSFYPGNITRNIIPPKVHFTGIELFNTPVKIGEKIGKKVILPKALTELNSVSLSYDSRSFSIGFAACHYQVPERNLVEYALDDGKYLHWNRVPASANKIQFSNLPPGKYTLKLRAANSDLVWTDHYESLDIIILSPWWGTSLAIALYILMVLLIILGFMFLVLHRQALKHSLNIEKIEKGKMHEINELKLKFFTNISHELKTPLNLTLGPIEDILKREEPSYQYVRKQLHLAYRNARILLRLINQVIDFRRVNAGKMKLAYSRMDYGKFINHAIKNFEYIQNKKDVQLYMSLPEDPFPLWFDPLKMEDILNNLLSNAYKFVNHSGDVMVSLYKTREVLPWTNTPVECAKLEVFNSGSSIPCEDLNMIFERFYKSDEKYGGSGIGLALTKSLVELHHGSISVTSTPEGVSFAVFLPLGSVHISDEEKVTEYNYDYNEHPYIQEDEYDPTETVSEQPDSRDHEYNLLIIDDDEEFRNFIMNCYRKNFNLYEANNGKEGYKLAHDIIPDIIICDVVMPEMNGLEFCEAVKKDMKTCHIPVILLTTQDMAESKIAGFASGADAYIVKPFERQVLESQIKRLIKNRKLVQEKYLQKISSNQQVTGSTCSDDKFIETLMVTLEENLSDPFFNVNNLASKLSMSSSQLYKKVKALTGCTPVEFLRRTRLAKAAGMLKEKKYFIKEVSYMTGFNSPWYFIKCFREHYGMTPNQFINSESNMDG